MNIDEMLEAVKKNVTSTVIDKDGFVTLNSNTTPKASNNIEAKDENAMGVTLKAAKEIIHGVEEAAKMMQLKVVIAVVNRGANLVALEAMDDSYIASIKIAQDKAYTAVSLKMPTHVALEQSRGGALDGLTNGEGILLLGGGEPLIKDGVIYGAVAVSGGTKDQDIALAQIGAKIFELRN